MNRGTALVITFIFVIIIFIISFWCINLSAFSTFAITFLFGLVILNIFYPPKNNVQVSADFSLLVYAAFQITAILYLIFFILYKALEDEKRLRKIVKKGDFNENESIFNLLKIND